MISVEDALALIAAHAPERQTETVSVASSLNRLCAAPVIAAHTMPPRNVSAMDGYAVCETDVPAPGFVWDVIGESAAGQPFDGTVSPDQAVRIFTGAVLPTGTHGVIIQENIRRDGTRAELITDDATLGHVRRAGQDFRIGDTLVHAGDIMTPARIALASAGNVSEISVLTPLTVAVISGGDELHTPGTILPEGHIIDSNTPGLSALVTQAGGRAVSYGIARDSVAAIREKIDAAAEADIIVTAGGASVGDHDHMKAAFTEAGFEIIFSKIAVKPGKPTWFAKRGKQLVLGLPGNPASAFVCATLFLLPLLGREATRTQATLTHPIKANGPREHYLRARLSVSADGTSVGALNNQDSSLITRLVGANALIKLGPNAGPIAKGDKIDVVMFGPTRPDFA